MLGSEQAPGISGEHTTDGSGTGSYTSQMTELDPGTTYYVKAYATNSVGTAYGQEESFTTTALSQPSVITGTAYNITETGANIDGEVTDDGGAGITERGVCYGTSTNPSVSDNVVIKGGDIGSFSALLTGLTAGTEYYFRAFATNNVGTAYGSEGVFTTISGSNLLAYSPFNNSVNDESGNGNHGTNNGAITTYDRFGDANSAMLFDDSFVECNQLISETDDFTVNIWIYADTLDGAIWSQCIFNTDNRIYGGIDESNGKAFLWYANSSGTVELLTSTSLEVKKWYMLTFIREFYIFNFQSFYLFFPFAFCL